LAQVPRPLHGADLRLDYATRLGAAFLLLLCVLCARRLWNVGNPIIDDGPGVVKVIASAAWIELVFSLFWIVLLTTYR
jgi:hypothetical protein